MEVLNHFEERLLDKIKRGWRGAQTSWYKIAEGGKDLVEQLLEYTGTHGHQTGLCDGGGIDGCVSSHETTAQPLIYNTTPSGNTT